MNLKRFWAIIGSTGALFLLGAIFYCIWFTGMPIALRFLITGFILLTIGSVGAV